MQVDAEHIMACWEKDHPEMIEKYRANNFKLAAVGEWAWAPFLIVSIAFAAVHGNWWLTAIAWALMIAALLGCTKSLGACIIAHATTNLLLAVYVLYSRDWAFW